jgi:hypothetical protein
LFGERPSLRRVFFASMGPKSNFVDGVASLACVASRVFAPTFGLASDGSRFAERYFCNHREEEG